ncbi:MAG TPA: hypothetical protein VMP01_27705 [Pirellulaceae bacterium]|nr:hypothetical protein [Pirellulaceae bacterium]
MHRFTVTWTDSAQAVLASLWNDNPAVRQEISDSANEIDRTLAKCGDEVGEQLPGRQRHLALPPLAILFIVEEQDRRIDVTAVKFWER